MQPDLTRPAPKENLSEGYELLLVDHQELLTRHGLERFYHIAYRVLTDGAVENQSQISIDFSPAYQSITLNRVTVARNGRTVDQLKPAQIHVARREENLESHIIEDSRTLTLVLENVQPGDVVEYSYSRTGANPVFAGHYMSTFSTGASVPMHQLHYRILAPRERTLFVRASEPMPAPVVTERGELREYLWTARDVLPRLFDSDVPDWYDAMPTVRVTDYPAWSAVAAWADSLFVVPTRLTPRLAARVDGIRAEESSPEARVIAALRFVQDSIRYVGIEIGANSHRPFPPAAVLARGYGDCKDKVLLLVTMLRALGIDASPALVSTTYHEHLREFLPTSSAFDHAIVRGEVGGRAFWVDPTALYQRGGLEAITPPFRAALVVTPATDSLTAIPRGPAAEPVTEISVRFDLGAVGAPAAMRVETLYRGADADQVRARVRGRSLPELSKEYTNYYARLYPGVTVTAPPTIDDDETGNVVRTVEQYTIPVFWRESRKGRGHVGTMEPLELSDAVPSVSSTNRSMPLSVPYPVHCKYTITAHFGEGWRIKSEADTIVTPGVRFTRSQTVEGKALVLRYEYRALSDAVPASLAAAHIEKLAAIQGQISMAVTPPANSASGDSEADFSEVNGMALLLAVVTLALGTFGAIRLARSDPPRWFKNVAEPDAALSGLGGWLILVGISVCIRPLLLVSTMAKTGASYSAASWAARTVPGGSDYHPLFGPTLLFELAANLILLVLATWLVIEFFRRRRWFPPLFILLTAASVAVVVTDELLANRIPALQGRATNWAAQGRALVLGLIWSLYMLKSIRVRSTFVR